MQISFYEEFPTRENLEKLKLINFPSRLFIAAHSLKEFQKFEKQAKKLNKKITCAYWPIVKNSYWISPFSNTKDLTELFKELNSCKNHLLIELEHPTLNKKLIIKNLLYFFKNKRLIKNFLEKNKHRITTAQFPAASINWLMKALGLNYNTNLKKVLCGIQAWALLK